MEKKLQNLCKKIYAGGTPDTQNGDYYGGEIPWLRTAELRKSVIEFAKKSITKEGLEASAARMFPPGTVMIALYGATAGESSLLKIEVSANQACLGLIPDEDLNSFFLLYSLEFHKRRIVSLSAGSGQSNLSKNTVANYKIAVPPKPEQRKIASVLYTVDQAIQKTEEIIEQTKKIKNGLVQNLMTRGASEHNYKKVKVPMLPERWTVPQNWELVFAEEITTKITDGSHQTPTYVDEGKPFLKVEDIQTSEINWDEVARISKHEFEELNKSSKPQKNDILLSKNGTIGITKLVDWSKEFNHFVSLALIRPDTDKVLPEFLEKILSSRICLHQATVRSKTNTVTNLHLNEIKKFSIPLPPKSEQKKISEIINQVQGLKETEIKRRKNLTKLKKGLMQDLLTGDVRMKDKEIEVLEEVLAHE